MMNSVFEQLREAADARTFAARCDRDRDLIRHGYLLALEEVERALSEHDSAIRSDAA